MEWFLLWILFAVFSSMVATSKGRHPFGWFVAGAIFGPLALISVGFMPKVEQIGAPTPDMHVKCPDCAELVLREAKKCKHCGCALVPQPLESPDNEPVRYTPPRQTG